MEITGTGLKLEAVEKFSRGGEKASLSQTAKANMTKSREYIESQIRSGQVMYGVNTGFGALSSVRISDDKIEQLQKNLIRSHSSGVGVPFTREETRAILLLRANTIARGHSGVRPEVCEKILEFLNHDILPVIPTQGSVGASGDLAPLSHLALALIGEGEVWGEDGPIETAQELKRKKIEPLQLKAKEGLSLINGCQVMTAVGLLTAHKARMACAVADVAGALSLEALRGSRSPFDPLISESRPHPGEIKTARNMRRILGAESEISKSHENCDRVQDAYSLRCIPAVHGAVKDALNRAIETLEIEANSSTDNPLVFSDEGKILSCGNFHGEPVAFQLDFLAIAMSALASISQCRVSRLINPSFSALPAFLAKDGGLNSGLMIVEVAAASLVSENKVHSHPASVDTIPTSVDKEDHVSMGTIAARKLKVIVENTLNVLAMEVLSSTQALAFLSPMKPCAGVQAAYEKVIRISPLAEQDRVFSKDIRNIKELIETGQILACVERVVGELEL